MGGTQKTAISGPRRLGLNSRCLTIVLAALMLLGIVLPDRALAQSATGAISGIVTDAQGGVVPNAEVAATNTQTRVITTTKTNESGVYNLPYLRLGTYEVRITAPGLKATVVTGVVVDQANISRVDRTLELGNVTESITVEANRAASPTGEHDLRC